MNATREGIVAGVITGIIVLAAALLIRKRRGGQEAVYDERQEAIRGRGYKYAYYTAMALSLIYAVCFMDGSAMLIDPALGVMAIIWISGLVLAVYTIWQDAYWGIDEKRRPGMTLIWFMVIIMMFGYGVKYLLDGRMIVNGVVTFEGGITFLTAGFMSILLAANLIRAYLDKKDGDAE